MFPPIPSSPSSQLLKCGYKVFLILKKDPRSKGFTAQSPVTVKQNYFKVDVGILMDEEGRKEGREDFLSLAIQLKSLVCFKGVDR